VLTAAGEVLCPQGVHRGPWGLVSREHFRDLAIVGGFGCGRRADDTVGCWGRAGASPPAATRFISLEAGGGSICGIRSEDRRITCWGVRGRGSSGTDFE
jgi:hypothetical protein